MTLKEFLKTKTFKYNALAVVGITTFLIVLNMFALTDLYTIMENQLKYRNLRGKTTAEVSEILNKIDLRFQIRDSVLFARNSTRNGTRSFSEGRNESKGKPNHIYYPLCALVRKKFQCHSLPIFHTVRRSILSKVQAWLPE